MQEREMKNISLDDIDSKDETFRYRATISVSSLADNIRENGLQIPIVVRPRPGGKHQLISGFRRTAALRLLKERGDLDDEFVPAVVRYDLDDDLAAAKSSVIENQARASFTDIDRAHAIVAMRGLGVSDEEVQTTFGIGLRQVQKLAQLVSFPSELQEAIAERKLKPSHAIRLMQHVRKFPTTDVRKWIKWVDDNNATLKDLIADLRKTASVERKSGPPKLYDLKQKRGKPVIRTYSIQIDDSLDTIQKNELIKQIRSLLRFAEGL
jgi:ParB family transcriptional regulator, chromosome partitioning protein